MGTTNYGTQNITFRFRHEGKSPEFNVLMDSIVPTGLYSGGLLSKVSANSVQVGKLICFIKDSTPSSKISIRVQTSQDVIINGVNTTDCYIVARYTWEYRDTCYMDIFATDFSSLFANEASLNSGFIILGKAIFNGSTMQDDFDYALRGEASLQTLENNKKTFFVKAFNDPTVNKLWVYGGKANINGKYVSLPLTGQQFPAGSDIITTTAGLKGRIDIIYVDPNGDIKIKYGAEPPSNYTIPPVTVNGFNVPSFLSLNGLTELPDFPTEGMTIAVIIRGPGRTTLENRDIIQIRPDRICFSGSESDVTFQKNVTIKQNLDVDGTLTVRGSTEIINTQTVRLSDNILTVNSEQTGTPLATLISGMEIERGNLDNYYFVFDEGDTSFKIGTSTDIAGARPGSIAQLQKVATREDTPVPKGIPIWDATTFKFITDPYFLFDTANNTKQVTIGNDIANNRADVRINGSITIGATAGTITLNNPTTINNHFEITSDANNWTAKYKGEDLDVRYLHASPFTSDTTISQNNLRIVSGRQIYIFPNNGSVIDSTVRTLEDAFLLKYSYGTNTSQTISTDIFMNNLNKIVYHGDDLDDRYVQRNYKESGSHSAFEDTIWGGLHLISEGSAVGYLTIDGDLTVGTVAANRLYAKANGTMFKYNNVDVALCRGTAGSHQDIYAARALVADSTTGNSGSATKFNTTRTLTINGADSTTASTTSDNGVYTIGIEGVKVNQAGNADLVNGQLANIITTDGQGGTTIMSNASVKVYDSARLNGLVEKIDNSVNSICKRDGNGKITAASFISTTHSKNDSSPAYVWGSGSTTGELASYNTSKLNVNTAVTATNATYLYTVSHPAISASLSLDGSNRYLFSASDGKDVRVKYADVAAAAGPSTQTDAVKIGVMDGQSYAAGQKIQYLTFVDTGADGTYRALHGNSYLNFDCNTRTLNSVAYNATSARSEKENIRDCKLEALKLLEEVKIVEFNYKSDSEKNNRVGFIADDTSEVLSTKNKDKMDIGSSIGVLIKAVQELNRKVDSYLGTYA